MLNEDISINKTYKHLRSTKHRSIKKDIHEIINIKKQKNLSRLHLEEIALREICLIDQKLRKTPVDIKCCL